MASMASEKQIKRKVAPFSMKQFTLRHDRSALKVGTDGVLLGATVAHLFRVDPPKRVLDIGSGSGVVTLMLAQAFAQAVFTGVEIDHGSYLDAEENRCNSPFAERITFHHCDFLQWAEQAPSEGFDLIVSNPPFYTETHQAESQGSTLAKHIDLLPPERLLHTLCPLFDSSKCSALVLIFSVNEAEYFHLAANHIGLYLQSRIHISGKVGLSSKREIALWSTQPLHAPTTETHLSILQSDHRHDYTPAYRSLLSPYLTIL